MERIMASPQSNSRLRVSQSAATLSGIILFGVGLVGVLGIKIEILYRMSRLTHPTAWGSEFDGLYWTALAAVGLWLISHLGTKWAAATAIFLVCMKLALVG